MALANAALGIVHGLASVIGGLLPAPHGAICARLLPPAMKANLSAMRQRQADHPALGRLAEVGEMLAAEARPEAAVEWSQRSVDDLGLPRLAEYGLTEAMLPTVVRGSARASSTRGNPIPLLEDEVAGILRDAL
jgi:alcohol dehydrogenase class IV